MKKILFFIIFVVAVIFIVHNGQIRYEYYPASVERVRHDPISYGTDNPEILQELMKIDEKSGYLDCSELEFSSFQENFTNPWTNRSCDRFLNNMCRCVVYNNNFETRHSYWIYHNNLSSIDSYERLVLDCGDGKIYPKSPNNELLCNSLSMNMMSVRFFHENISFINGMVSDDYYAISDACRYIIDDADDISLFHVSRDPDPLRIYSLRYNNTDYQIRCVNFVYVCYLSILVNERYTILLDCSA